MNPHAIDRYWVESVIGRGGFGAVYRARHMHTRQVVALKMLRASAASAGHTPDHLVREAQILATVRHRNIVQVFDAGVVDGTAFIAMELVDGASIEQLLAQTPVLPMKTVLSLATQLLEGLGAAHAVGVVHRDIKPGNLLVLPDGTLKILDFGISKSNLIQATSSSHDTWLGTPGYMAPEQYAAGHVDHRADLYAAAVTIYRMAAGARPFPETDFARLLTRLMRERAPSLSQTIPNAPPALVRALDCALARDPDARFASADAFRQALVEDTTPAATDDATTEETQVPFGSHTEHLPRMAPQPFDVGAGSAQPAISGSVGIVTPGPTPPSAGMYDGGTPAGATPHGFGLPATEKPPSASANAAAPRRFGVILGVLTVFALVGASALLFSLRRSHTSPAPTAAGTPSATVNGMVDRAPADAPIRRDPLVAALPAMAASSLPVPTQDPQPTVPAPIFSGSPPGPTAGAAVALSGISIFYPATVPQGLDPNAFVSVASAAAPTARACLPAGQGTAVRIQIMVNGPEIPENDHKIVLLQPSADNTGDAAVARCVAEAFRRVVPNPWRAANATRIIKFTVRLGP